MLSVYKCVGDVGLFDYYLDFVRNKVRLLVLDYNLWIATSRIIIYYIGEQNSQGYITTSIYFLRLLR
jgi:hypothetical protein